ncbi:MAG: thiamine biosynthesis protein ApbE [Alkaliphilus sp.]|nr:FAD:protein FMN transferase [bacterium AH-315-G05]PHS35967.1 MAG: thiamine biosynthesis protein ApbE [Alkaliphilus sp.]
MFRECRLSQTTFALGTVININLYDEGSQELMTELIEKISNIEKAMSKNLKDSEISQINRQAGIAPVKVSEETYFVLERAIEFAELSDGKFDPTIGPIIDLWGIGTEAAKVPDAKELSKRLSKVDYKKVQLNKEEQTIYLELEGMALDLGGIAKGYTADALVQLLQANQVNKAMLNLGGNVFAYGEKNNGKPWKIAIQNSFDQRNNYFGYVEVVNKTVVTSGSYERYFEEEGHVYHHIFDATTGVPVQTEAVSVSVIADSSTDADALSTILFTLSIKEGIALVENLEGIECIYVTADKEIYLSSGVKEIFTLTDERYVIKHN